MKNNILIYIALLFLPSTIIAQVNVQGTYTSILSSGSTASKYDIVFIGDGFTAAEQNIFNQKVNDAVTALQNLQPYSDRMCALNIWRVNVVSNESGVDHPADGITKDTELDCRYGNPADSEAERCITSDSPAKCYEAANYAPAYDAVFVLVNDTQWGGCAGGLVFSSISTNFANIITHELGHKIGNLADEYTCYICNGSDSNESYTGPEPTRVNLTTITDRTTTKWADKIDAATPLPTTTNIPPGVVGLWEGGGYKARDIYRPQSNCQMKNSNIRFCKVCRDEMERILTSRCSFCDLNPSSVLCLVGRWDLIEVPWWYRLRIRFPWPPVCLSCPPDIFRFDYEVLFESIVNPGATVIVYDQNGKEIAQGVTQEQGQPLSVKFSGTRFKNYTIELDTGKPSSKSLQLNPKILANGKEMRF